MAVENAKNLFHDVKLCEISLKTSILKGLFCQIQEATLASRVVLGGADATVLIDALLMDGAVVCVSTCRCFFKRQQIRSFILFYFERVCFLLREKCPLMQIYADWLGESDLDEKSR